MFMPPTAPDVQVTEKCQHCGLTMTWKHGRGRWFLGCPNFAVNGCRQTVVIEQGTWQVVRQVNSGTAQARGTAMAAFEALWLEKLMPMSEAHRWLAEALGVNLITVIARGFTDDMYPQITTLCWEKHDALTRPSVVEPVAEPAPRKRAPRKPAAKKTVKKTTKKPVRRKSLDRSAKRRR